MTLRKSSSEQVAYVVQGVEKLRKPNHKRPFGNCPSRLNVCEAHMWRKLVRACVPGLLLPSDRVCFELLVKLATKLYWNGHFYPTLTAGERKVLVTLAAKFGMTPGDRKMIVDKQAQSQWVEEGKEKYGL